MKKSFFIIIRGPMGVGKSTVAKKLAKKLNAEYILIDRILDEYRLTGDWESGYISQKSFIKANEISVRGVKKILENGKPVVFDGNFYWKSQIEDLVKRLGKYNSYVFALKASLNVCIKRDSGRKKSYGKDAAEAVYKKSNSFSCGDIMDTECKDVASVVNEIKGFLK